MPQAATGRFTDIEDYQTSLLDVKADLVVTQAGAFAAQLAWVKLPNLYLLEAQEALARVAYMSFEVAAVYVSFATRQGPGLFWNGAELLPDEMLVHGPGEHFHQRTTGPTNWGLLAFTPSFFGRYGSALAGYHLEPPTISQIVRPKAEDFVRLLRLHARVARLVEAKPVTIVQPEVGRAVQHEVLDALVACLTDGEARIPSRTVLGHAAIIARFEAVLSDHPDRLLPVAKLCALLDVSKRTLWTCCVQLLGVSPAGYIRLRRLKTVRAALADADTAPARVGEIARRSGFLEMGRFAAAYRTAFGESPSATLHHARNLPTSV
jgi:AraC-like DNA-binding protein